MHQDWTSKLNLQNHYLSSWMSGLFCPTAQSKISQTCGFARQGKHLSLLDYFHKSMEGFLGLFRRSGNEWLLLFFQVGFMTWLMTNLQKLKPFCDWVKVFTMKFTPPHSSGGWHHWSCLEACIVPLLPWSPSPCMTVECPPTKSFRCNTPRHGSKICRIFISFCIMPVF